MTRRNAGAPPGDGPDGSRATQRTRARRSADRLHESLFRALADNERVALWQVDHDGNTIWLNSGMKRLLRVRGLSDLRGRSYREFFSERSLARIAAEARARAEGRTTSYELDLLDSDGEPHQVIVTGSPVHDEDGRYASRLGVFTDVTELRRTQVALLRSEAKYRRFFVEGLTGNFLSTRDGRILDCNPAYLRIFGLESLEEARSLDAAALYPSPEDRERYLRVLREVRAIDGLEVELRRRDGSPVWVVENVRAEFGDDGEIVTIRGYLFDVTERRLLEEQLRHSQKMEAVGQLAGGVAHDFNNSLTALLGYVDMLEPVVRADAAGARLLGQVRAAAEQAVSVTRHLLAYGRRQLLQPEVVDPRNVIRQVESMLVRLMPETIRVNVGLGEDVGSVLVDGGQLQQVLVNLAINARDAMPDGGRLTLAVDRVDLDAPRSTPTVCLPAGRYVRLEVTDTGTGMDEDVLARAFEPFFTTKGDVGTGLGLSTAYGFVRQSGGDLRARSRVGHGSTFEVLLPAVEPDPVPVSATDPPRPERNNGEETILVVEDEDSVRGLVEEILRMYGYRVIACENGETALRTASEHDGGIDLMLTDVVMPGMHGGELAERLRPIRPETKIVFMSGYAPESIAPKGIVEGEVEFLPKPFRANELAAKIRTVLDG